MIQKLRLSVVLFIVACGIIGCNSGAKRPQTATARREPKRISGGCCGKLGAVHCVREGQK